MARRSPSSRFPVSLFTFFVFGTSTGPIPSRVSFDCVLRRCCFQAVPTSWFQCPRTETCADSWKEVSFGRLHDDCFESFLFDGGMLVMGLGFGLVSSCNYVEILLGRASVQSGQRTERFDLRGLASSADPVKCMLPLVAQTNLVFERLALVPLGQKRYA
jgi:hypothetical protein